MLETLTFSRLELEQVLAAVLEYNGRHAGQMQFTDAAGRLVDVAQVHIACEAAAIQVRTQREPTPEERARAVGMSPLDPTKVSPPLSLQDLNNLVDRG